MISQSSTVSFSVPDDHWGLYQSGIFRSFQKRHTEMLERNGRHRPAHVPRAQRRQSGCPRSLSADYSAAERLVCIISAVHGREYWPLYAVRSLCVPLGDGGLMIERFDTCGLISGLPCLNVQFAAYCSRSIRGLLSGSSLLRSSSLGSSAAMTVSHILIASRLHATVR